MRMAQGQVLSFQKSCSPSAGEGWRLPSRISPVILASGWVKIGIRSHLVSIGCWPIVNRWQSEEFFLRHEGKCFRLFQLVKILKVVLVLCFLLLV
jgi:hypothetical protein